MKTKKNKHDNISQEERTDALYARFVKRFGKDEKVRKILSGIIKKVHIGKD